MGLFKKITIFRIALAMGGLSLTACDNNFSYQEVFRNCEPPNSSARFGENQGPVITSPAPGTPYNGTMTVGGTCVDGMMVTISGSGVLAPQDVMCAGGTFSADVTFNDGEGDKEIDVSQNTNSGGNAILDRLCFVQDTIPPNVVITGSGGAQSTNQTTIEIGGICESGLDVRIGGGNIVTPVTTSCNRGRFVATVTFTGTDGLKNVVAEQTDLAGNNGDDDQDYVTDTTAPIVRILNPAPMTLTQNSIDVSGSCEADYPVILGGAGLLGGIAVADCVAGNFNTTIILSAGDGLKNIEAAQSDAAGNRGTDDRDFMKDNTPPAVAFTSPAAGSLSTGNLAVTGTCEAGLNVTISGSGLGAPVIRPCNAGNFNANLVLTAPDGMKNLSASQTDPAGNVGSDSRNFLRDATAPLVTIDNPAAGTVVQASVNISGSCETGINVDIAGAGVAAPQSVNCAASSYSANVALTAGDGNKNVSVSQTDLAGNAGSDSRSFVRDETGPSVVITAPAANSYVGNDATIDGTCESGLNVELSGDLASPVTTACVGGNFSSLVDFSAGDGNKNVMASQTDLAGNTGTDNRSFIKDTTAPVLSIQTPAEGSIHGASATLTGICEDGIQIDVGGAGAVADTQACVTGAFSFDVTFSVGDGLKQVSLRQVDPAGNVGIAIRNLVKDTGIPGVAITSPAAGTEAQTGVTLDGVCEDGLNVDLSGAGLDSPASTVCNSGLFSVAILFTAGEGNKNIIVSQTDMAGNVGTDNRDFVRDNTAPVIAITSPAAGTTTSSIINLVGTCESGITVDLSGAGLGGPASTPCVGGNFNVNITLNAPDGNKNIIASQTDAAGNSASDNRDFVRDSIGPNIAITAPTAGTVGQNGLLVSGVCENGYSVDLSGDIAGQSVACAAGAWSANVVFSAGDGNKNIIASQTDGAGNTASDARSFVRDTTAPLVTIANPAAGTSAATGLTVSGACENGLDVDLSGDITVQSVACAAGAWTANVVFSAGDGSKNVVASQTDVAGNTGSDNRNFERDSSAPAIAITAPAANSYHQNGLRLEGTCESGLTVDLSGDLTSPASTACAAGLFSVDIVLTAGDGTKNIVASQTDGAGNTASDNRDFIKDTVGPVVAITNPAPNSFIGNPFNVSGNCETGLNVDISGAGVSNPGSTPCAAGAWNYNVIPTNGDGNKRVMASQTDGAGNSGSDQRDFTRDSGAPVVQITSPAALTEAQNGLTIQGLCEAGVDVDLSGAGLSAPLSTACAGGAFSQAITFSAGDGVKNIVASQTDGAGNTGSDNRDFIRDTTAPAVAITSPAAGTIAASGLAVSGTCETGYDVDLSGDIAAQSVACAAGAWNANVIFSAGDGAKNVVASQMDAAGNSASDNRSFTRDGTAPVVAITSPAAGTSAQNTIDIAGTCETGLLVDLSGDITAASVACIAGAFGATITMNAGDGVKNVVASQTDAGGNTGSDNRNFNRDTTAPLVAINSPAANAFVAAVDSLSGTCETGTDVDLSGDITAQSVACLGGAWNASVTFSAGDGVKNVIASQTDLAGNSASDNRSFVRDSTLPAIAITSPAAGTTDATGLAISGTCETGLNVDLSGDIAAQSVACAAGAWNANVIFSAGDGVKNVVASQTDGAGNTASDNRNFNRDSTAPAVLITSPAAGTTDATGLAVSGTCETGLNVDLSGDIAAQSVACAAGAWNANVIFSAGDGVKNVVASQTDGSGNTGSDNRNFNRDNTAPLVAITSPAAGTVGATGLAVSGTCENGLNVDLSGDIAAQSVACAAGAWNANVIFSAGDGVKNVVASQTDGSGNTGSDNRNFNRDSTAPLVAITSPAAGTTDATGLAVSGTCETGLNVDLSGDIAAQSVACAAGAWNANVIFSAGDGVKNVVASQTDAAGNTGSDNRNFNRDGTAPAVLITSPAAGTTDATGLAVSGTCETGLNVDLSGDIAAQSVACAAGAWNANVIFSAGDGVKNVVASQTDGSGNTGSDNRNFNRDNTAPAVAITAPAVGTNASSGLNVSGSCETGLNVDLSGDIAAQSVACAAGAWSANVIFSAGDGVKNVVASQTDGSGNTGSDNRNFNRDSTAPLVAITSPAAGTTDSSGLNVSGTCENGLNVDLSGDIAAQSVVCVGGAWNANVIFSAGDGVKNVVASQTDGSGNTGSDNRNFNRDGTAPAVLITSPAAGTTDATGLAVSGTCETGLNVDLSGDIASQSVACAAGAWNANVIFSAGDGVKNVVASQTDGSGNTGSDNRNFNRDNTAPAVAITAPAAGTTASTGLNISGSCETGLNVDLSGDIATQSVACAAGAWNANVIFSAGDGVKNVVASQTDGSGNTASDNRNFNRDSTAPVIAITAPAAGTTDPVGVTVSGVCENGILVDVSGAGVANPGTENCIGGAFTAIITFTAGDGVKNVVVSQTDIGGNTGSDNRDFNRDGTAPAVAITAPAAGTTAQSSLLLSGTCENGLNVDLSGDITAQSVACAGGAWSATVNFSAGDGAKNVIAAQTDGAGNTGSDSRSFTRDTTAPVVAITSPAANTNAAVGLNISGTCESGLDVVLSGAVAADVTVACVGNAFNGDIVFSNGNGVKNITATQTDLAGNVGSDNRNFVKANNAGYFTFSSQGPGGMVDILFIDDNSASMEAEQAALGDRFASFTTELSGLDWQVGITTTDCSGGAWGICGSMLTMEGTASHILTETTPNFLTVFQDTIQRPETFDPISGNSCILTGNCPSGNEQPLLATMTAMDKRNTDNAGFFRDGADLAVVILSDEDERSFAPVGTRPATDVTDRFSALWPANKKFISYGIIIQPGDAACLADQRAQFGNNGYEGTRAQDLADLTGGITVSICQPDYSVTLQQIGEDVTRLSRSVDLPETPIPGTVSIVFTPAHVSTFSVSGNRVTIDNPAPLGTQVEIFYEY